MGTVPAVDALVEVPSRDALRRVRAARLAIEVRAPAGTGLVWTPNTIGAVPEEMDFEESMRRRLSAADPDRLAQMYGHAWARRRAATPPRAEGPRPDQDVVVPTPIEDCERCQMRQRWGAGRCARCAAEAVPDRTPSRRSNTNDAVALMIAVVILLAVISSTVIALQRSGDSDRVNRCDRVVGDASDVSDC